MLCQHWELAIIDASNDSDSYDHSGRINRAGSLALPTDFDRHDKLENFQVLVTPPEICSIL